VGASTTDGQARLVARLRAGDVAALGEAYDAHHAHVRAFARRLLGDDSAAEDLVQDTFVALPGAIARFRGESALRTFIVSVAVNHARHHVRAAVRRRAAMQRFAEDPADHASGPESGAAGRELAAALVDALDELPLDQRVAIVLCEVEERTAGEVARIVDAPEATVRTRVFHAKRKLREALEKRSLR
jgi:RNA polymerase sigma-70 factor (ECF subfamily)